MSYRTVNTESSSAKTNDGYSLHYSSGAARSPVSREKSFANPSIPSHPHRKTMLVPTESDLDTLDEVLKTNFGTSKDSHLASSYASSRASSEQEEQEWKQMERDMVGDVVLVLYDYQAQSEDDLDVLEGDLLRVVAVEGEWLYGLLLVPSAPDSNDYVPAQINGRHQAGWIPLNFTDPL
jgi:hypothetical protein